MCLAALSCLRCKLLHAVVHQSLSFSHKTAGYPQVLGTWNTRASRSDWFSESTVFQEVLALSSASYTGLLSWHIGLTIGYLSLGPEQQSDMGQGGKAGEKCHEEHELLETLFDWARMSAGPCAGRRFEESRGEGTRLKWLVEGKYINCKEKRGRCGIRPSWRRLNAPG